MKNILSHIIVISILVATSAVAFAEAVLKDSASVKFTDVPGFAGLQMAVVEGDSAKGPHHMFLKYDAGFSAPMHHHSANHYVAVVSGTLVLLTDGKEHRLPPGSYFSFTKKGAHATKCEAGADCVIFLDVRGKWDVVLPATK